MGLDDMTTFRAGCKTSSYCKRYLSLELSIRISCKPFPTKCALET